MNSINKIIYTLALMIGFNAYSIDPNFELMNKNANSIFYSLNNNNFKEIYPNQWDSSKIDSTKATKLLIALNDPKKGTKIYEYVINPGKTIYARVKTEKGQYVFGPQTGPLFGITGKSERGYSLKNNFKSSDFKSTTSTSTPQPIDPKEQIRQNLIKAIYNNYNIEDVKKIIIQKNADINSQDDQGRTALMEASIKGTTEIAKLLINAKANLDLQEKYSKFTALMHAAENGKDEVAKLLIDSGANLSLTGTVSMFSTDALKLTNYKMIETDAVRTGKQKIRKYIEEAMNKKK